MPQSLMTRMDKNKSENYKACMVLAAVGDARGYYNGTWEFQTSGLLIHNQMMDMTKNKGPLYLTINLAWKYSDDTVMHIATARALSKVKKNSSIEEIGREMAVQYKKCWSRMSGRAPGRTTGKSIMILNQDGSNWNKIPFMDKAAGCGGSMRSACIGLVFDKLEKVVEVSVQAGRLTHHNPIGYLGSVVSACFTYFAIRGINPVLWGALLFKDVFPMALDYVKKSGRELQLNLGHQWAFFEKAWDSYLTLRGLSRDVNNPKEPVFPKPYEIMERQHFYKEVSYKGWGGASGHDSVIIAYDCILGCNGSWEEVCLRGILHGGDNDSTGTIAGAWFGALYGFKGVPQNHHKEVQDVNTLLQLGQMLYKVANS